MSTIVKPLKWEDCGEDMGWCADTIVGRYWVEETVNGWQVRLITILHETEDERFVVRGVAFEQARDAAFADYETRILSAIEPRG